MTVDHCLAPGCRLLVAPDSRVYCAEHRDRSRPAEAELRRRVGHVCREHPHDGQEGLFGD